MHERGTHIKKEPTRLALAGTSSHFPYFYHPFLTSLCVAPSRSCAQGGADKDGFFICGDTAQTISRGVGFRFTDVRSLFGGRPKLQPLLVNYRTHAGVLSAANAIVALLMRLFPNTLDRLKDEQGHFLGPPPALLPETSPQSVAELMLPADDVGMLEMGANQVVLVRSEAAKARLPLFLQSGLVLTVEESKGLEFDDVCIFDFFSDSPKECAWLVINSLDGEAGTAASTSSDGCRSVAADGTRSIAFDINKHQVLCEELKSLYVGITRARKRCFVFDASEERRAPLFKFLHRMGVAELGLEQVLSVSATRSLTKNTAEDWLRQGENMYSNQLWSHAEFCFLKGGDEARAFDAGAKQLSADANALRGGDPTARAAAYNKSATAWMQCAALQSPGFAREKCLRQAAKVWYASAGLFQGSLSSRSYREAGIVLRDGLCLQRDALSCFIRAAEQSPRDRPAWQLALEAARRLGADDSSIGRLSFLAANATGADTAALLANMEPLLDTFLSMDVEFGGA